MTRLELELREAPGHRTDALIEQAKRAATMRGPSLRTMLSVAVLLGVLAVSTWESELSPQAVAQGVPNILDFLSRMFPPDFSELGKAVRLMLETLAIAVTGTAIGVIFAVPLGALAARTVYPEAWIQYPARLLINIVRAVPELMWALLFVTAVGLGPMAGASAIAVGSAAGMGRLFADIFESNDQRSWHAAASAGAGRLQRISWVLLPESLPDLTSYTLLLLDANVRAASLLGLVGAGGIGMELNQKLRLFEYGQVLTIVIVVLVVVVALDRISAQLRKRLT